MVLDIGDISNECVKFKFQYFKSTYSRYITVLLYENIRNIVYLPKHIIDFSCENI